jgi:hypothetical protein
MQSRVIATIAQAGKATIESGISLLLGGFELLNKIESES